MTDTNQASEDELLGAIRIAISKDFETIYVKEFTTNWKIKRLSRNLEIGVMDFDAIQALIRTEKLKLLASVRERVIGEHKPANDDDAKYNFPEHHDRLNARHELSIEQRAALAKLEAEL